MQWRYTIGYLLVTTCSLLLIVGHSRYTKKLNESHAELDQIFDTAADVTFPRLLYQFKVSDFGLLVSEELC